MKFTWEWDLGKMSILPRLRGLAERNSQCRELIPLYSHLSLAFSGFPTAPGFQSNKRPLINRNPAAQQTSSKALRIWLTPVQQGDF